MDFLGASLRTRSLPVSISAPTSVIKLDENLAFLLLFMVLAYEKEVIFLASGSFKFILTEILSPILLLLLKPTPTQELAKSTLLHLSPPSFAANGQTTALH